MSKFGEETNEMWTSTRMDSRVMARALWSIHEPVMVRLGAEEIPIRLESNFLEEKNDDPVRAWNEKTLVVPNKDGILDAFGAEMRKNGSDAVIRDMEALDAAMALVWASAPYTENLSDIAAALFESIVVRHPLKDGNKRLALLSALTFCSLNGQDVEVDDDLLFRAASGAAHKLHPFSVVGEVLENSFSGRTLIKRRAEWNRAWKEENAHVLEEHAKWVEKNGLPLTEISALRTGAGKNE